MNFMCVNKETQKLLDMDIHTNVNKQNELRATQNDIMIQEQINEVQRRRKDLQVCLCTYYRSMRDLFYKYF